MAYSYTKHSEDALDVIQDSIVKALGYIKKMDPLTISMLGSIKF